ncbi:hypothetical protein [Silvanigrella sp.]|uniref:hypothetical protein n=1 Tax=Silvanigrella sp. TaxID=2024976 RepID=UPI0037C7331D
MRKIILSCLSLLAISCGGKAYADCAIAPNGGTICTDSRSKSLTMTAYEIASSGNSCLGTTPDWYNAHKSGSKWHKYCGYNSGVYDDMFTYSGVWSNSPNGIIAQTNLLNYKTNASTVKVFGQTKVTFRARNNGYFGEWNGYVGSHPNNGNFFIVELISSDGTILARNSYGPQTIVWDTPMMISLTTDINKNDLKPFYFRAYTSVPNNNWLAPIPLMEIEKIFLQVQDIGEVFKTQVSFSEIKHTAKPIAKGTFKNRLAELAKNDTSPDQYFRNKYLKLYGELP